MDYPEVWRRCPVCGDFAIHGHITCGRLGCNEGKQRELAAERDRFREAFRRMLISRQGEP
jgi:hypothetical protein